MRKHTEQARPDIPVRKPRIQFRPERSRRWHRNSITTLMPHALSPLFPEGERFFIRSVLAYKDQITEPKLQEEIRQFVAQEAVHTAEHLKYDEASNTHYDMEGMEAMTKRVLDNVSKLLTLVDGKLGFDKKRIELAITVGLEPCWVSRCLNTPKLSGVWTRSLPSCGTGMPPKRLNTRRLRSTCTRLWAVNTWNALRFSGLLQWESTSPLWPIWPV